MFALLSTAVAVVTDPVHPVTGLVAAVLTPFDADMKVNVSVVPAQAEYLRATGVGSVFVAGTTGESLKLTVDERKKLYTAWAQEPDFLHIAHVGDECLQNAIELTQFAVSAGYKAIGVMPSVFFKPPNVDALVAWLKPIAEAANGLPMFYYHIPSMTGVEFVMLDLVKAAKDIPNFAGIKYTGLYTHPSYMDVTKILAYENGKYQVLSGREDMMLEGLVAGMVGHIGSQFNFAGEVYNKVRAAFSAGDIPAARRFQLRAIELLDIGLGPNEGANGIKFMSVLAGVPVGESRLPTVPLTDAAKSDLHRLSVEWCKQDMGSDNKYETSPVFCGGVEQYDSA